MQNPYRDVLWRIHRLKKELLFFQKSVWPIREAMASLQRLDTPLIKKSTRPFLRDAYDHIIQVIDTVESFRDLVSGLLDTVLSLSGNRMNEVMKVLTLVATIFIPLTFIAGIYGMNFSYMPELAYRWAYFVILGIMLILAVAMLCFFRHRKWL